MKLKKILCFGLILVAVSLPDSVFCESPADPLAPNVPSARIWNKLDISFKTILIGGLLVGYRSGVATGAASEYRRLKNDTMNSKNEANRLIEKTKTLFYRPISFYVKQTDNFLQTFPACQDLRITDLLEQLASAWADTELKAQMGYTFIKEIEYEDIKKLCLENPPK